MKRSIICFQLAVAALGLIVAGATPAGATIASAKSSSSSKTPQLSLAAGRRFAVAASKKVKYDSSSVKDGEATRIIEEKLIGLGRCRRYRSLEDKPVGCPLIVERSETFTYPDGTSHQRRCEVGSNELLAASLISHGWFATHPRKIGFDFVFPFNSRFKVDVKRLLKTTGPMKSC